MSVFNWPTDRKLVIEGIKNDIVSASLLSNAKKLKYTKTDEILTIDLPENPTDKIATVIKIEIKGKLESKVSSEPKKKMKTGELD